MKYDTIIFNFVKVMSNTTACNDVHKEKRTKEFTKMSPARLKRMQLIKEKQNISENTHVQVKANQKSYQNLKQQKLEQISLSSPHNKDSNQTSKINETHVHRGEKSDIKNNQPTTSATSKEASTTYTQKQIKKLKKAIKSFFTDLDANQFNVEELTVKELRQNFEFGNGITLNKDGRKYFTDVGAKYLSFLLQNEQKNEGNNMQENRDHNRNKRKSSEASTSHSGSYESPAKVKRVGQTSSNIHNVQCPICLSMFSGSEIENHAALCGSVDTNDIQVLAHTTPTSNTVVDCSDNSSLSKQEQENWIKYSQKPKPYQKRLNCSEYENTLLARCPTCGQKYKASEIEIHSDECAEKVFSGYTRMGLHLVKTKKEGKKPKTAQLLTGPIMID
nr:uncharacterized protein LOC100185289 [Ciona intestinalis]|eukprot:XP_018669299.2 uncharacterized protein LOC100185289 [Ciona intestinalis]